MSAYWTDFIRLMMPGLLWTSASAVPLAIGVVFGGIHLWRVNLGAYRRQLWGGTAAGFVALLLLWGALFGDGLGKSSSAGLIFLFVPIYSAIALAVGYGLGALAHRIATSKVADGNSPQVTTNERRLFLVPLGMLAVLLFGMVKYSFQHNDMTVAGHATNPETLHWVHQKSVKGEADGFSVPLFLAQNPAVPAEILQQLSRHDHVSVRIFVVRHPNTSTAIVASMANDCDARIREEARSRLRTAAASNNAPQPTPNCGRG